MYPIWHKDKKQFKWAVVISLDSNPMHEKDRVNSRDSTTSARTCDTNAIASHQRQSSLLRVISQKKQRGFFGDGLELVDIHNKIIRIRVLRARRGSEQLSQRVNTERLLNQLVVRFKVHWQSDAVESISEVPKCINLSFYPCQGEKEQSVVTLGDFWVHSQQDSFLAALHQQRFDPEKALAMVGVQQHLHTHQTTFSRAAPVDGHPCALRRSRTQSRHVGP